MAKFENKSMAAVFRNQAEKYGDRTCVSYKKDEEYTDISWSRMNKMVRDIASFLLSMGIKQGERIAIFSPNRYEWWITDLAILSVGAVDIPIYATNSAKEAFYVLDHSAARACFVAGQEWLDKILKVKDLLPNMDFIVTYDPVTKTGTRIYSFADAMEQGQALDSDKEINSRINSIDPSDPATILYTSGTTGTPKGVMLSHNNILSDIEQVLADFRDILTENDLFLSFLPLSHALERTTSYYIAITLGSSVAFAESFSTIQKNLLEIRPTVIVSVPRLFEKIHTGILTKVENASVLKKTLFYWAIRVAEKNVKYECTGKPRKGWFAVRYKIADKLVISKIKAALGMDRINFTFSGGGPVSRSDIEFFIGMGIPVIEGYGLTEASPITNVNRSWLIKPGTVGPPLKDTTIQISDEGEILIKGPQIMLGYFKDEKGTGESFTSDGFLRTGDLGFVDEDGYLSITGRIKEIIITSGGSNISPQNLENSLSDSRFIEQVAIIGDRRKYISALIIPAFEELKKWAEESGIQFKEWEDMVRNEKVIELYENEIKRYTSQFARVQQIRKFRILATAWSQETGELTPTMKVKRMAIEKIYSKEIEEMYSP
ncbi:MAG TPA: long-chain fatty acid--CoA ligase [Desulfobacteraceae bacterium]|nr:long-chain fatty acid--CoA ligase [Desulfobacteraceae bacterium]HPJ68122.1 long-chain fatty acid--CoA ligase [Desulfobacteraceae bacterium]HPQ27956.1 long-chain fatty acid--CoA ligase [Desulfobacteraceae bacterium]